MPGRQGWEVSAIPIRTTREGEWRQGFLLVSASGRAILKELV